MNHQKIRALRWVNRFNFHPMIRTTTVAEHSFFTALLAYEFTVLFQPDIAEVVAVHALFHDLEEAITGDIPALVKRKIPFTVLDNLEDSARRELEICIPEHGWIIDLADAVECKLYLEEERALGNTTTYDIEREIMRRINECLDVIDNQDVSRRVYSMVDPVPELPVPKEISHL